MNAPLLNQDDLAEARKEAWRLLQSTVHYCRCAQMHLQSADDPVAIWDITAARDYFKSAWETFEPVRAAMRQRVTPPEREPKQ